MQLSRAIVMAFLASAVHVQAAPSEEAQKCKELDGQCWNLFKSAFGPNPADCTSKLKDSEQKTLELCTDHPDNKDASNMCSNGNDESTEAECAAAIAEVVKAFSWSSWVKYTTKGRVSAVVSVLVLVGVVFGVMKMMAKKEGNVEENDDESDGV